MVKNPFDLTGKVALVTGAAAGIGAAIAECLAHAGAIVIMTDVNKTDGQAKADSLVEMGLESEFRKQDVAQETEWQAIIDDIVAAHGSLDILVNNAGILIGGLMTDLSLKQFRRVYSINVDGVFLGMKYAAQVMRPSGSSARGGSIINISSIAGIIGSPGEAAYGSSKGAVRVMTKHAAVEFSALGYGVRVNSVHPGVIATKMGDQVFETLGSNKILDSVEAAQKFVTSLVPMKRLGTPEEIAHVVHFLASDASAYVTGSEYVVDGGFTAM